MDFNKSQYKKYAEGKAKKSPLGMNLLKAFIIGGIICTIGQGINDIFFKVLSLSKDNAATMTSVTLIFLSAFLTAINVYDDIAKHGGAGTLVPITGFANAVVSPAMEFKNEGYIMGVAANIFKIAGPVITYGVIASVLGGIIYLFI